MWVSLVFYVNCPMRTTQTGVHSVKHLAGSTGHTHPMTSFPKLFSILAEGFTIDIITKYTLRCGWKLHRQVVSRLWVHALDWFSGLWEHEGAAECSACVSGSIAEISVFCFSVRLDSSSVLKSSSVTEASNTVKFIFSRILCAASRCTLLSHLCFLIV